MASLAEIISHSQTPETDIESFMIKAMAMKKEGSSTEQARAILEAAELERFIARDQFEFVISGLTRRLDDGDLESALSYLIRLGNNLVDL